jgi:hypothetical protein
LIALQQRLRLDDATTKANDFRAQAAGARRPTDRYFRFFEAASKNGRHRLAGLLRQSVFGRLAGYEDRLRRDPVMRWGDRAISGSAASASQMGRFETK